MYVTLASKFFLSSFLFLNEETRNEGNSIRNEMKKEKEREGEEMNVECGDKEQQIMFSDKQVVETDTGEKCVAKGMDE